ncbi:glycosyltransferase family 4 protein [Enterococcus larvae]|uniref:glycosyltransferase family 4 protein n=1 Tax=Enterococcus larvae TaxID=2794352 RepID=UPI003F2A2D38
MAVKVLYILHEDTKFGASKSMIDLIVTLKAQYGITPIVLSFEEDTEVNNFLNGNDIKVIATQHRRNVYTKTNYLRDLALYLPKYIRYKTALNKALKKVEKQINFEEIDLIHSNTSIINFGAVLSKKFSIPHIWHIREFAKLDFDFAFMNLNQIRFMNNNTNRFVFISHCLKDYWINKGIEENKSRVVYNGVNTSRIKKKEVYGNQSLNIVMVGGITPNKGQIKLIEAMNHLSDEDRLDIQVDFYGRGSDSYYEELTKIIAKYGLQSNITFKGYSDSIEQELANYDLGVIASRAEAFGRTTVEYMSAGLAVLASNSGANVELIKNAETGMIFENSEELAEKIMYLKKNRDILRKIADKGQKEARTIYTKEKNAENIMCVYNELLEGGNDT